MTRKYNLSLIFYPQKNGGHFVLCPEVDCCFAEGETKEEARENIYNVIADFLPDAVHKVDEEMFREGYCVEGKTFEEAEFEINESGEVITPSDKLAHAVGDEG